MTNSDQHDEQQPHRLGLSADEVLTTTRAVRKRLDLQRPVPREVIEDCVRVAVQAPSGRNQQAFDFVFVKDPDTRAAVAQLWRRGLVSPVGSGASGPEPTRMRFDSDEWNRIASSLDTLTQHLHEVPVLLIPCLRVGDRAELQTIRGQAGAWGSVMPAFWSFMLRGRPRICPTSARWRNCSASPSTRSYRRRSRRWPTRSAPTSDLAHVPTTGRSAIGTAGSSG
jgi:nitroreductase